MSDMNQILTKSLKTMQTKLMNRKESLSELFDKISLNAQFHVPENSIVINIDNITFGPARYTVLIKEIEDVYFKVIYFSILYFIFEQKQCNKNNQTYIKLLEYIFYQEIDIIGQPILTDMEIKVYFTKFLYILSEERLKNKLIVEQLSNLPQISILFSTLIKQISGHRELKFQENAREIEKNIMSILGIQVDLLSSELFLIEEFQIEMRHFDDNCQFAIFHEGKERVDKIRNEFYMGQSAYFKNEPNSKLCADNERDLMKKSMKVVKKSTIQSVQWGGDESQMEMRGQDDNQYLFQNIFGSIPMIESMPQNDEIQNQDPLKTQDITPLKPNMDKPRNFHEIIEAQKNKKEQQVQQRINDEMVASTTRSTTFSQKYDENFGISRNLNHMYGAYYPRKKDHFPSLQINPLSTTLNNNSYKLNASYSTKFIKTDDCFARNRREQNKQKRVPAFILKRKKTITTEEAIPKTTLEKQQIKVVNLTPTKSIRITFSYK